MTKPERTLEMQIPLGAIPQVVNLLKRYTERQNRPKPPPTARQLEILQLHRKGMHNTHIAAQLQTSRGHVINVLAKLGGQV